MSALQKSVILCGSNKKIVCELHVQLRYFNLIFSGVKTVEGRIAHEKYCLLQAGDRIRFFTKDTTQNPSTPVLRALEARVLSSEKFPTFTDMLGYYGLKHCLPGIKTLSEGLAIYHGFPGYEEEAKRLGVIGIEIRPESLP